MSDGTRKRGALKQISKDDEPEEDTPVEWTFKKASEDVLATRRIVRVKRAAPPPSSANPFSGIQLVAPTAAPASSTANAADKAESPTGAIEPEVTPEVAAENGQEEAEKPEVEEPEKPEVEDPGTDKPDVEDPADKTSEKPEVEDPAEEKPSGKATMTFQQVSSNTNAFGNFGTGFSSSTFSFGIAASSPATASSFSFGNSSSSSVGFGFGSSGAKPADGFSLFGNAESGTSSPGAPAPQNYATVSLQEVQTETGEEKEKPAFSVDATLYEFVDQSWKERGKGEIRLNVSEDEAKRARLVMRSKGNLRLLLNASLFPDMRLNKMDNKSVTFACMNSAATNSATLTTYAIKLRDASKLTDFIQLVEAHRGTKAATSTEEEEASNKEDAAAAAAAPEAKS